MKYYKIDEKEEIDGNNPKEISLEVALREIDKQSIDPFGDILEYFIGFVKNNEEKIQFIRYEENSWYIDVPILEKGENSHSLNDDDLSTEKVKEIVKRFFLGENWRSLCNFKEESERKGS